MEPNPIDTPLLPDGQASTLTEMMFDYSGSGSGNVPINVSPGAWMWEGQDRCPLSQLMEPNSIDTPLLPDSQPSTVTELMFDYSGSGSGDVPIDVSWGTDVGGAGQVSAVSAREAQPC